MNFNLHCAISLGLPGADPGFQVRGGAHKKKMRRAEGGAKLFWVFRVKNHDFTPKKNHIFSNFGSDPDYQKRMSNVVSKISSLFLQNVFFHQLSMIWILHGSDVSLIYGRNEALVCN
jgi:hypothetical protein